MPQRLAHPFGDPRAEAEHDLGRRFLRYPDAPGVFEVLGGIKVRRDGVFFAQRPHGANALNLESADGPRRLAEADDVHGAAHGIRLEEVGGKLVGEGLPVFHLMGDFDLFAARPGAGQGFQHFQKRAVVAAMGAFQHRRRAHHVLADQGRQMLQRFAQFAQRAGGVGVVLVGAGGEQTRGQVQRQSLVHVHADAHLIAVAQDANAALVFPNGHAEL